MKFQLSSVFFTATILGLLVTGCKNTSSENPVVSQKFIHKYGYAVSKAEWESSKYPGQVVTMLRNGVTITNTYEAGMLHGPTSYTYPHSQTIESYFLYSNGDVVKEILYDIKGMPMSETVQVSPSRYNVTHWYQDGCPMSVEEYAYSELLEGQYFTTTNELEARVDKGNGIRVRRDQQGVLLSKDEIASGYMIKRESFYPNGVPEGIAFYQQNKLNGEKKTFAQNGEPIAVEEYVDGKLHGKATYYKNGTKQSEVSYLYGERNGKTIHYIDGERMSEESEWENDKRHGLTVYYLDDESRSQWYYDGEEVSSSYFEELNKVDALLTNGDRA